MNIFITIYFFISCYLFKKNKINNTSLNFLAFLTTISAASWLIAYNASISIAQYITIGLIIVCFFFYKSTNEPQRYITTTYFSFYYTGVYVLITYFLSSLAFDNYQTQKLFYHNVTQQAAKAAKTKLYSNLESDALFSLVEKGYYQYKTPQLHKEYLALKLFLGYSINEKEYATLERLSSQHKGYLSLTYITCPDLTENDDLTPDTEDKIDIDFFIQQHNLTQMQQKISEDCSVFYKNLSQ